MLINIDIDKVKQLRAGLNDGTIKITVLNTLLEEIELQVSGIVPGSTEKPLKKPRRNLKKQRLLDCAEYLRNHP